MPNTPYKLCFFVYRQLGTLVRQVIDKLEYIDTEISLVECSFEDLSSFVEQATNEGTEVFIAGSANAAEFCRQSYGHLVEINIRLIDYLLAIKKASKIGKTPMITVYKYSNPIDWDTLHSLSETHAEIVFYEDSAELAEIIKTTHCDVIIGASHTVELAEELHKKSILVYQGESTIKSAIIRARNLAIELRNESRKNDITNAIINHSPFGIIVTDEQGKTVIFNQSARKQTNVGNIQIRGKRLSDLIPVLSQDSFLKSGLLQVENNRIINGVKLQCTQTCIKSGDQTVGVLTTLNPNNTRRKNNALITDLTYTAKWNWKNSICKSKIMQSFIQIAKRYSETDYPLIIDGAPATGKNFISHCIHNGSANAKKPFIIINMASLHGQDAPRTLFGNSETSQAGLLEIAGSGTIVLQNLQKSSDEAQACLLQVLTEGTFSRVGITAPIQFSARIISILENDIHDSTLSPGLYHRLNVLHLTIPSLQKRTDDIFPFFYSFLLQSGGHLPKSYFKEFNCILIAYSWPGNLAELSAVAKRYFIKWHDTTRPTINVCRRMLIESIGENTLFEDIKNKYPGLNSINSCSSEELRIAVLELKRVLHYNNAKIAELLSLSRTTLWRITKNDSSNN